MLVRVFRSAGLQNSQNSSFFQAEVASEPQKVTNA
jgi:hypothetical protein